MTPRLRRSPLFTLSPDGMLFANLAKPLSWTSIHDIQAQVLSQPGVTVINVSFELADEANQRVFSGDRRVKMKKGKLVAVAQGVRDMTSDAFLEKLHQYWQGGLARAELSQLSELSALHQRG